MTTGWEAEEERLTSLALVLPLALTGFVVASGCWTLFAVAGVHVRAELALTGLQFGLLLAAPMACSAFLALPAGLASQRYGARRVMLLCLSGLALCMALLLVARSYTEFLLAAGGLGMAGGFYCAGLQFVTAHSPPKRLGLALGTFGSGVTGAGLNYYLVPLFHDAFSWRGVAVAYLLILLLVLALIVLLTTSQNTETEHRSDTNLTTHLIKTRAHHCWQHCLLFGLVAGSFFTLALWLPDYLSSQFAIDVQAGAELALWFILPGAMAQIAGGALADRFGSATVLTRSLILCLTALLALAYPPMTLLIRGTDTLIELHFVLPLTLEALFILSLGLSMGTAIGSLQRLAIAATSPPTAALTAGLLLVCASLVAFALPVVFSAMNHWLEIRTSAFMALFVLLAVCLLIFARHRRHLERERLLYRGKKPAYYQ